MRCVPATACLPPAFPVSPDREKEITGGVRERERAREKGALQREPPSALCCAAATTSHAAAGTTPATPAAAAARTTTTTGRPWPQGRPLAVCGRPSACRRKSAARWAASSARLVRAASLLAPVRDVLCVLVFCDHIIASRLPDGPQVLRDWCVLRAFLQRKVMITKFCATGACCVPARPCRVLSLISSA